MGISNPLMPTSLTFFPFFFLRFPDRYEPSAQTVNPHAFADELQKTKGKGKGRVHKALSWQSVVSSGHAQLGSLGISF